MDVSLTSGCHDFVHSNFTTVITVLDVLTDATVKQNWFLRDEADLRTKPLNAKVSYVTTINLLQRQTN